MAKARINKLVWPAGGISRRAAYQNQPPYTCYDALNVRTTDVLEGRDRGGQRPGLERAFPNQIGSGSPVRMLSQMTINTGIATSRDDFDGTSLSSDWTEGSWFDVLPGITGSGRIRGYSGSHAGAVYRPLDIDTAESYTASLYVTGSYVGGQASYSDSRLYLRMDDTTPAGETNGVMVRFYRAGVAGVDVSLTVSVTVYVAGVSTVYSVGNYPNTENSIKLIANCTVSSNVLTVSIGSIEFSSIDLSAHGAAAGKRMAVSINDTNEYAISALAVNYTSSAGTGSISRATIASANGALYRAHAFGEFSEVVSDSSLSSESQIQSANLSSVMYIADYSNTPAVSVTNATISGTSLDSASIADWTAVCDDDDYAVEITSGSTPGVYQISSVAAGAVTLASSPGDDTDVSVRVVRCPKKYTLSTNTLGKWIATIGQVPVDCPIVCRFNGRLVLGGAVSAPHLWYQSAQNNPLDFDYSSTSPSGAVAGTSTEVGVIGEPLTAIVPYKDDFMIYGCNQQMWMQLGDLRFGGSIVNISRTVGIVGRSAWCFTPEGEFVWLSRDGVYMLNPGAAGQPIPVSREKLPMELMSVDAETHGVHMAWNERDRGIHIFITKEGDQTDSWFIHWQYKAFWRDRYVANHSPTSVAWNASGTVSSDSVLLGCHDGYVRKYSEYSPRDDGEAFNSNVWIGPVRIGGSNFSGGQLDSLCAVLDLDSASVDWDAYFSETAEGCLPPRYGDIDAFIEDELGVPLEDELGEELELDGVAGANGTWSEGLNYHDTVLRRGGAFALRVSGRLDAETSWAMEGVDAIRSDGGLAKL